MQVKKNKTKQFSNIKDVFSHVELDMVLDVHLEKHLKHFGLDMKELKKVF